VSCGGALARYLRAAVTPRPLGAGIVDRNATFSGASAAKIVVRRGIGRPRPPSAQAWALTEVGSFDSAEALLADLAQASDDVVRKTSVLGHLARLCLEWGRISVARGHLELALRLAED
jgi:hypothetical protein